MTKLEKAVDLLNPIETENYILNLPNSNRYKNILLEAYSKFTKANQIAWQKPKRLSFEQCQIKIPTEERIDLIISSCTKTYALVYKISKYGLRPDEISKITLRDLHLDRGELTVRASKLGKNNV